MIKKESIIVYKPHTQDAKQTLKMECTETEVQTGQSQLVIEMVEFLR